MFHQVLEMNRCTCLISFKLAYVNHVLFKFCRTRTLNHKWKYIMEVRELIIFFLGQSSVKLPQLKAQLISTLPKSTKEQQIINLNTKLPSFWFLGNSCSQTSSRWWFPRCIHRSWNNARSIPEMIRMHNQIHSPKPVW